MSKGLPGIGAIVVGILFILIGLLQPAFLWEMGKIRQGREVMGDTGIRVFFAVLGVAMVAAGVFVARRK